MLVPALRAQELNCNITINSDQIEGSSKETFEALKQSVTEFMNTNRWTNLTYTPIEKIDCNILIIVKAVNNGEFVCEATIQASRPVYNTTYTTTVLNMRDKAFNFKYQAYDQLLYQQNVFQTNLTAMLAYYAYLILGMDADSYQRLGGTPYFQQCENIVSAAQTASDLTEGEASGWQFSRSGGGFKSSSGRYVIVNELMDEAFKPYRNFFYEYHRMGLDEMQANVSNRTRGAARDQQSALRQHHRGYVPRRQTGRTGQHLLRRRASREKRHLRLAHVTRPHPLQHPRATDQKRLTMNN